MFLALARKSFPGLVVLLLIHFSLKKAETPGFRVLLPVQNARTDCAEVRFNDDSLQAAGWIKRFDENFDGDLRRWTAWQSGAYNRELQHYQAENIHLAGGVLAIQAVRDSVTGATRPTDPTPKAFGFTSGRMESKATFAPNRKARRVRLSARLKAAAGYGMWPAFWLCGDAWPTHGEVDILEVRGHDPHVYFTNYAYGPKPGENLVPDATGTVRSAVSLTDCWHVVELVWEKTTLTFLLDGRVVDVKAGGFVPHLFGKPQHLTLNLAVGGSFFGHPPAERIQPGTFYVDWVRVFTAE